MIPRTAEECTTALSNAPRPRRPEQFPPMHPQVLSTLLTKDQLWPAVAAFEHHIIIHPDGNYTSHKKPCTDHVPIYTIPRLDAHMNIAKLIHIWDRRIRNARETVRGRKFSLYNFPKVLNFLQQKYHTAPEKPIYFCKRDWRSFYPSMIKSCGVDTTIVDGQVYGTTRCVFGSHTEQCHRPVF